MEEAVHKKYIKCKYKVKKWESEFKEIYGNNPTKADIKSAPSHIKEAYKTYWKLKTLSLETSLVDVCLENDDSVDSCCFSLEEEKHNVSEPDIEKSLSENSLSEIPVEFNSNTIEASNSVSQEHLKGCHEANEDKVNTNFSNNIPNSEHEKKINGTTIWGSHLSMSNKKTEDKPKKDKSTVLSRFTEKLFAGASFKKRNPRKSLIRREKSTSSIPQPKSSLSSLTSNSNHSFSQPEELTEEKFSFVNSEDPVPDDSLSLDVNCSNFKIVSTVQTDTESRPVNLLQISMLDNIPKSQKRSFDRGWLQRLESAESMNTATLKQENSIDSGIELSDSSGVSLETKSTPQHVYDLRKQNEITTDDEDFVCDSDSESEKTKSAASFSIKTKLFGRLSSMDSSVGSLQKSSSLSSLKKFSNDAVESKTDKRPAGLYGCEIFSNNSKKIKLENEAIDINPIKNTALCKAVLGHTGINETCKQNKLYPLQPQVSHLVEIQNKNLSTKEKMQEDILKRKLATGKANENFVKLNIKKKTYVRGKKTMTFQKYKKQKWKQLKKKQNYDEKGVYKCFKCGDIGHFSKNCLKACDQLLPVEDLDEEDDSPFPTLKEAEEMAQEKSRNICVRRNLNDLPVHVVKEGINVHNLTPPPSLINSDDLMRFVKQEPVFKLTENGSLIDTPIIVIDALREFGFESWRPGQETAVMRVLSGLSTLVTLSTGSGKSLCYQLPAYLYHTMQQRITIVVSPLVSLMEDQVFSVPHCLKIACLNNSQSQKERETVYQQLRENSLHALLLSPEALAMGDRVNELLRSMPPVAFACIDEAHCISQWSHNFRPSYLMVCQTLREKFGVKTILGLTATATVATIASVSETLGLPDGVKGVICDTPLPNNLQLSVSRDKNKDSALIALLKGPRFSQCHSIIVYCTRRDECQRLAAYIRTCLQDVSKEDGVRKRGKLSWNAEAYHAGLTNARRKSVQKAFMSGRTRIVVATVAFGMGINKQDIHGIVHYNMPSAFERYVQEVGRAGRDGAEAHCHLFLNTEGEDLRELRRHIYADSVERHTIRKLLQRVFVACQCGEACPSHEVAFSVNETVSALDLPEENIATLLCYLELHARQWARVCSPAYTQCRILSYKGPKLIRNAVKECPPLAVAVAIELQKGVQLNKVTKLEFPIFPVARAINWDSGIVKQQLKNLEWTKVNDQPRSSGLKVEFHELGFRVQAPGNLSCEELDSALDSLTTRVEAQQTTALRQLEAIFNILMRVSHSSVDECLDKVDQEGCEKLRSDIRQYFTIENYLDAYSLPEVTLTNEEQVVADIRSLVNSYRDVSFSGRAVARIFHGISSPNYPPQQWGRCRFWRSHLNEDFKLICKLVTRELIKMR